MDDLLKELSHSNVGCYWENIFVGALAYTDDLTLLVLCPTALRRLLAICEKSGSELRLKFKTQCVRFSRERLGGHGIAFQFYMWQVYHADVLSMSPILDILYCMIFKMIWIF